MVGHIDWCLLSAFNLSQFLQVDVNLLVLHSLPGPTYVREFMREVPMVPGQGEQFWSVNPLTQKLIFPLLSTRPANYLEKCREHLLDHVSNILRLIFIGLMQAPSATNF